MGLLPWQSHFTFVTFKHLIFSLICHYWPNFCSPQCSPSHLNFVKFHFFTLNRVLLPRFPKYQYAPVSKWRWPAPLTPRTRPLEPSHQPLINGINDYSSHYGHKLPSGQGIHLPHMSLRIYGGIFGDHPRGNVLIVTPWKCRRNRGEFSMKLFPSPFPSESLRIFPHRNILRISLSRL